MIINNKMLCIICNKQYKSVSNLRTHYSSKIHKLNVVNSSKKNPVNNTNSSINTSNNVNQATKLSNNIGTKSMITQQTQVQHVHTNILPVVENDDISESGQIIRYECQGCDKTFSHKPNLYRHRNKCYFYIEAYKISCKTQLDVKFAAKLLKQQNISKIFNIR